MKKFAALLALLALMYGCSEVPDEVPQPQAEVGAEAAENVPESVDAPLAAAEPQAETEAEAIVEAAAPVRAEKPVAEDAAQKPFEIFSPELTYPGAYNGPLYGTSEQVGTTSMDSYFEGLDRNGINFFIGMFPIFGEPAPESLVSHRGLGYVIDAARKHPRRIIPFFNPGIGGEEIEEEGLLKTSLLGWYKGTLSSSRGIVGDSFIRGFGEVETQEWSARHNDPKIIELIELAEGNGIGFMFHPVASKMGDVEKIIEAYPETVFLIHMYREDLDKGRAQLIRMLKEHGNLYFSMDAAHIVHIDGDVIYEFDSSDKEASVRKFVSYYDAREKAMVDSAIEAYKPLVDAAPNKVMWGTEIGPEYAFEREVFDRAVKASRLVIGSFDEEDREAVGYRNALRIFGEGAVADEGIEVIDTRSWKYCTSPQVAGCDGGCDFEGDIETPEADACLLACTIRIKCIEKPEMDVG